MGRGVGNGFQLVNQIWRTESEALCELLIAPQSVRGEFEFYPVYFDCCIQIIASIVSALVGEESVSYVPIAIEKFILHHPPGGDQPLYCHTVLQDDGRDAPASAGSASGASIGCSPTGKATWSMSLPKFFSPYLA